ncbi:MAG: putative septation protein SpoVG [Candidatus Omnitrophica bacterium]|nr:putative septation protein SpoVG [Candidatus Omnitrophota bacterium]
MDIDVVSVRRVDGDGNLKAFVDVRLGGEIVVKGFSVMHGKNGVFVSMPRRAGRDGRWFDILSPLDESWKSRLEEKVLAAYEEGPAA